MLNYGQLKVNNAVIKKYENAFNKLKLADQQAINQQREKEEQFGFSVVTFFKIDTLNSEDIIHNNSFVVIEDLNSKITSSRDSKEEQSSYTPVVTLATLQNDTLLLSIGGFFLEGIIHKIYFGNVSSSYKEYFKYDSILRLHLNDPKVSALIVPAKTKVFAISSLDFKPGTTIYGEVELETDPYYTDAFGFKNNYIKKRLRYNYVFKVRVPKNST